MKFVENTLMNLTSTLTSTATSTLRRLRCVRPLRPLRPLLLATAMTWAGVSAQAATFNYTGAVDAGPLTGSAFSGSFSHAEPAARLDGALDLDSFTLDFNGNTYTLATADLAPQAWFASGSFLGIDYLDTDSFATSVHLVAGFFDLSQALFSYQVSGQDQGFGGFTRFTAVTAAVSEPSSIVLLLGGLGLMVALRRRDR